MWSFLFFRGPFFNLSIITNPMTNQLDAECRIAARIVSYLTSFVLMSPQAGFHKLSCVEDTYWVERLDMVDVQEMASEHLTQALSCWASSIISALDWPMPVYHLEYECREHHVNHQV